MAGPADLGRVENLLRLAYRETINPRGIRALVRGFNSKDNARFLHSIDRRTITVMFNQMPSWENRSKGGHSTYKNLITGVVVCWQAHNGKKNETAIAKKQATELCENLQKHINILGNDVFGYTQQNWKEEPDYRRVAQRIIRAAAQHIPHP